MTDGGGWYYQSVKDAIKKDGDMMDALDVAGATGGDQGACSATGRRP